MSHVQKTVVLCIVLHMYIAFAALIFQRCEYQAGIKKTRKLQEMMLQLVNICNVTTEKASRIIEKTLLSRIEDHYDEMSKSWNDFASSLWFVMTLFTTVGTGHIVPQTFNGRLFCMISSLFGIPLYALFLKHAGDHIINLLRQFISMCESRILQNNSNDIKHMNIKVLASAFLLMTATILVGAIGSFAFKWTYFEGIYFCFISLSTVGFGDLVPKIDNSTERKVFSAVYMLFNVLGLTIVSCFITSLVNSMEDITILWQKFIEKYPPCNIFAHETGHEADNNTNSGNIDEQVKD